MCKNFQGNMLFDSRKNETWKRMRQHEMQWGCFGWSHPINNCPKYEIFNWNHVLLCLNEYFVHWPAIASCSKTRVFILLRFIFFFRLIIRSQKKDQGKHLFQWWVTEHRIRCEPSHPSSNASSFQDFYKEIHSVIIFSQRVVQKVGSFPSEKIAITSRGLFQLFLPKEYIL